MLSPWLADNHFDIVGIGWMFALSRLRVLATVSGGKYHRECAHNCLFSLRTSAEKDDDENTGERLIPCVKAIF
ncbi:MAG: hypothetical protein ACI9WS_001398 [Paraglaciecola psychrophila]